MNAEPAHPAAAVALTGEEMAWLLRKARRTVEDAVAGRRSEPEAEGQVPERLRERRGCFVTLWKAGALRGCIGNVLPRDPLHRMIAANARAAALEDVRFSPVTPEEVPRLVVEVSVLTPPKLLAHTDAKDLLNRLVPHRDGVFLQIGPRAATFLPQVWASLPEPHVFLSRLAEKAGCAANDWQRPDAQVLVYQAQWQEEAAPAHVAGD